MPEMEEWRRILQRSPTTNSVEGISLNGQDNLRLRGKSMPSKEISIIVLIADKSTSMQKPPSRSQVTQHLP